MCWFNYFGLLVGQYIIVCGIVGKWLVDLWCDVVEQFLLYLVVGIGIGFIIGGCVLGIGFCWIVGVVVLYFGWVYVKFDVWIEFFDGGGNLGYELLGVMLLLVVF